MTIINKWDWTPKHLRNWCELRQASVYIDTVLVETTEREAVIIQDGDYALALVPYRAVEPGPFSPPPLNQGARLYALWWGGPEMGWCVRYITFLPLCMETTAEALKQAVFSG